MPPCGEAPAGEGPAGIVSGCDKVLLSYPAQRADQPQETRVGFPSSRRASSLHSGSFSSRSLCSLDASRPVPQAKAGLRMGMIHPLNVPSMRDQPSQIHQSRASNPVRTRRKPIMEFSAGWPKEGESITSEAGTALGIRRRSARSSRGSPRRRLAHFTAAGAVHPGALIVAVRTVVGAVASEPLQRPPAEDLPSLLVEVQVVHVFHRATRGCHSL